MNDPHITKRGVITTASTAAGVAAILLLNPAGLDLTQIQNSAQDSSSGGSSSSNSSAAGSSASSDGTSASPSSTETDTGSASQGVTDGTYEGDVYQNRYGNVQVSVTITNGAIADITWLQAPSGGESGRISEQAAPILVQEALAAQSANVDSVTGASYTSDDFQSSLQSALDQAGL